MRANQYTRAIDYPQNPHHCPPNVVFFAEKAATKRVRTFVQHRPKIGKWLLSIPLCIIPLIVVPLHAKHLSSLLREKKSDSSGICSKSDRPDGRRTEHLILLSEVKSFVERSLPCKNHLRKSVLRG